jgi:intein/homing endonuclease
MKISEIKNKVPPQLYDILSKQGFDKFRPAQEKAIKKGLLDDKNLVVCTPTASGKCMHYSSKVLISTGNLVKIGELHKKNFSDLYVLSLNEKNLKIEKKKVKAIHKIYHNKPLIEIETSLGNSIKVTPEHPFLVKRDSFLKWIRADELKIQDHVVVPRIVRFEKKDSRLNKQEMLHSLSPCYTKNHQLVNGLVNKIKKPHRKVAQKLKVNEQMYYNWRSRSAIPVKKLFALAKLAGESVISKIKYVNDINGLSSLKLPEKVTKRIARLLGLIIADGSIRPKKSGVYFTNMDKKLRDEFKKICREEFNIITKTESRSKKSPQEIAYSKIFGQLLISWGIPSGRKSSRVVVPEFIFCQSNKIVACFLSALFDCDGSVYSKGIEYATDSRQLAFEIQCLLLRWGIVAIRKKRFFKGKMRHRVFISGNNNLKNFHKNIGFQNEIKKKKLYAFIKNKKKNHTNIDVIPHINQEFRRLKKENRISIKDMPSSFESYLYGWRKNISRPSASKLKILSESDIFFDKIKRIKFTDSEEYVYDLTVPGTNNFIAENIIVHNTWVAMLAAVKNILKNKGKAVYIVPLKALASEKYKEFTKLFPFLKIALSIGDLDSTDPYLADYDLIITTSEKLDSLIRHKAYWVNQLHTIVIDETHLINDPGRGPTLEILITMLRQILKKHQIIALSATIGNPGTLADWLEAELVIDMWRPVELKQATYLDNKLEYF